MEELKFLLENKTKQKLDFNKKLLTEHIREVVEHSMIISKIIYETISKKGKVIICGNGGSHSQASHLSAELIVRFQANSKRPPLASISLGSDASTITACGNDFGYENIFVRQLEALLNLNDCFISFSTSGKSRNVLEAINFSSKIIPKDKIVLITGKNNLDFESITKISCPLIGETDNYQEYHLLLIHMICHSLEFLYKEDR